MIFGSLWPMQPIGQAVAEIEALPIKDQTKRKWLHENAARFLRL
jgi:predicted TIM-barrel fold metal-dependent hydrolase